MKDQILSCNLITAIKTPFLMDRSIDYDSFDTLMEIQINHNVDGVVVGGTTGEGHLLTWKEHIELIRHATYNYGDKIVIIGNTASNNTFEAVDATKRGFKSNMHATLQINPYYGKTSIKGLLRHFETVLDIGQAIIYNVPSRTNQDIPFEVIQEISKHKNFLGVKECMGVDRIQLYSENNIASWSGNDDQAYQSKHKAGALGLVSVTANIVPSVMKCVMDNKDETHFDQILPLIHWLFREPNPIGINTALCMLGLVKPVFRLPYVPYDKYLREEGLVLMQKLTQDKLPRKVLQVCKDSDFNIL